MKKLQELIEIVNPTKLKGVKVLGRSDTLIDRLYHLIRTGEVENDEDALRLLYNNSGSKVALYQIKEKLSEKLFDSIFIIDLTEKNYSIEALAYVESAKNTAVFEFMSRRGGQKNIIPLGKKILKSAIKYNHAALVVRVSKLLARKFVIIEGDEKMFDYYHQLYNKYTKIESLQTQAEYYWYKISVKFNKKRIIVNNQIAKQTEQYANDLESKMIPGHTCFTFAYLILLRIRKCEIEHDYESVVKLVNRNLPKLNDYPDAQAGIYNGFLNKKLSALITLRKYKEANQTAHENLKHVREGQKIWFTLLDSIIVLNFYEANYVEAFRVYLISVNHSGFKFLTDSRKEIYSVYRAYLQFFINIEMLDYPDDVKKKPFRYVKFNNEVHIFTKDKKGINITFIVAQFLLLFTEGKYRLANEKIDSVKSYTKKHLRADETYRSNCFLKMLVKLVECDFHKAATLRKTKTLYEKLQNHPPNAKRLRSDVEVVPYEHLWEMILDRIDNRFRGGLKKKVNKKGVKKKKS